MKTGLMIRMTAMTAACIFGATTIAASPKEDPVKTEIRKSLEEGQQAIEKGTEQTSSRYQVTEVPEIIFLDETESNDAVGNNSVTDDSDVITDDSYIDDDEYDWDSDIISYEEYEREQAEAGYETPDEELFETVADERNYEDKQSCEDDQNDGEMQDDEEPEENSDSEDEEDENGENQAGEITAIGDSVMLGAASAIQDEIPGIDVDAREGRQMVAAIEIAEKLNEEGKLGDTVVIALGTNGPFLQSEGQELVDVIGQERTIYWILSYGQGDALGWQGDVNETIEAIASEKSNVTVIDWPSLAEQNPNYIYPDGIHLAPDGQVGYAEMIKAAIEE